MGNKAPPLLAILMAIQKPVCNATCISLANAACPGLHWKPLDAAIGQLLAPYCPGGRQGTKQNNNNEKNTPTLLAIMMVMVMRQYNTKTSLIGLVLILAGAVFYGTIICNLY